MDIKFSIIMASYNNANFARDAIESVLAQSYQNWELLIVDDASNDRSAVIIREYLGDKRIKFFQNKKNLGVGATKRKCAEMATGDIFAVLDIDDVLDKNALLTMEREYRENPEVDFVYSDTYECDENLAVKRVLPWVGELESGKTNLHTFKVCQLRTFKKVLYKKTEGYNPELKSAVDKDIIYKLEEKGRLKYIKIPLYYYRIHQNGISKTPDVNLKNLGRLSGVLAERNAYRRRKKSGFCNLTRKEMSVKLLDGLSPAIRLKKIILFFELFFYSIYLYPFNLKRYRIFINNIIKK
ncbi:MAG: glycosyltransferase [Patescibacteria group bacterium]|jgi:glycosyltransferase involved in cell wall biosynthesis|nr:glycosyltransferase [Patescibacteria group bacterium]